jgi:excisionase family DNA binding protein
MQSHSSTIYRLLRRGQFRAFKVGARWSFTRESIDQLVHESSNDAVRKREPGDFRTR